MGKVVIIDGGKYVFASIELWGGQYLKLIEKECKKIKEDYDKDRDHEVYIQAKNNADFLIKSRTVYLSQSHYTFFNMIISVLKKVKIEKDDLVILAMDGKNSWRRAFYPSYKGQRGAARDSKKHIDYPEHYQRINEVVENIQRNTEIHCVRMNDVYTYEDLINTPESLRFDIHPDSSKFNETYGIESDDILAVGCLHFKDKEVICITGDKDCYQLVFHKNVKVMSNNLKTPKGGKNGAYVVDCDPLKLLSEKCRLGDVSDNIIVDKNYPEKDAEVRRFIIDLLNVPDFLLKPIVEMFNSLKPKENNFSQLPFPNSLAKRFPEIYTDKNYVSYEYCKQLHEKKLEQKKAKKKKTAKAKK